MKRTLILLLALLMITLTACSNVPESSFSGSKPESEPEDTVPSETETNKSEESFSQEASAETSTDTEDPDKGISDESEEVSTSEIAEVDSKWDEAPSSQAVNDPSPETNKEKGSSTPEPEAHESQTEAPASEEPQPVEESEADPLSQETSAPEPDPAPESEPEPESDPEPVHSLDIEYWISYAKSVATSKGLVLESSAVDCWDNPITANPNCIYLERDINSRLNRYANDEEITDVWIWYECTGENQYLIYIGYA